MQWKNSKSRYGALPQMLHWLTALCVFCGWPLGFFLDNFPKGAERDFALAAHMTFGQCVFVLVLVQLIWRFANSPPPPEKTPWGRLVLIAAKLAHFALFALLLVIPWLGIIVQLKRGNPLPVFALWEFNSPWPVDKATAKSVLQIHGLLANTLLVLAGLHAVAALVHHYAFRDRTLVRMLPGTA